MSEVKCDSCIELAVHECSRCKRPVCDDCNCGTNTVDGYLCGTYTQWGCARKYTNCDLCENDVAIHEEDFNMCDECGEAHCEECTGTNMKSCTECDILYCNECLEEHQCD